MSDKKLTFTDINKRVSDSVKKLANTGAIDQVVDKRVDAEIDRRAGLLEKGLDKYNTTMKDLKKCVPDTRLYGSVENDNGDGGANVAQSFYSESKIKEKKGLQKTIADLEIAIMKALEEEADYSKLQQLVGSNGKPKE